MAYRKDSEFDPDELTNKIFRGEVAAVHNYGAFVRIPGYDRLQGLVHKSQISASNVPDATEVIEKGDSVWCKIINITDDRKIGLSMKVVDQGNGIDLDPNGVQMHLDEQQRRERGPRSESNAIHLEAVFKTTCGKCGVTGHLAKDCFKSGEKVYELIPEPEKPVKIFGTEEDRMKRTGEQFVPDEKKVKKKRKRKRSSSSDSSDEHRRKKKKKKEKKSKKSKKNKD